MSNRSFTPLLALAAMFLLSSCIVLPKKDIQADTNLNGCLPFPNCVSTQSSSFIHSIESFELIEPIEDAWPTIQTVVGNLPNTKIIEQSSYYLYAKSYSALFRFVDYVEVLGVSESNQLQVRSSSLLGLSDLGVNRRRTNQLRDALVAEGLIRSSIP